MTYATRLLAGAAIIAAALCVPATPPAQAQGAPQTVTLMKVDQATLATGYRTSKVVGSSVHNEADENVGLRPARTACL